MPNIDVTHVIIILLRRRYQEIDRDDWNPDVYGSLAGVEPCQAALFSLVQNLHGPL